MPINEFTRGKKPVFDEKRARSGRAMTIAKIAGYVATLMKANNDNISEYDTPDDYRHELIIENYTLTEIANKLIHHIADMEVMQV